MKKKKTPATDMKFCPKSGTEEYSVYFQNVYKKLGKKHYQHKKKNI